MKSYATHIFHNDQTLNSGFRKTYKAMTSNL